MPGLSCRANRLASFAAAALWLAWPVLAQCAEPSPGPSVRELERRVRELEEVVRRLEAERLPMAVSPVPLTLPAPKEPSTQAPVEEGTGPEAMAGAKESAGAASAGQSAEGSGQPILAGWDKGFFLRSSDRKHSLRLTGQIQSDYRAFLERNDITDIDTFLVRRARLGIEANVFEFYEFRLLPDFSNVQAPGVPASTRIQDAYLNVHYWDCFQVEAGKFKQPFSYEQLIQDRFVPTLERSLIDQLVPARDVGVMVHGQKLCADRLDYYVSFSNGERDGDFDSNDRKDFTWRIVTRPFNGPAFWDCLHLFQIGMAGTTGVEDEVPVPLTLRTPATVPWFAFNAGVRADGLRNRWSPEISYFYGPLGFAAQHFWMDQDFQPAPVGGSLQAPVSVPFTGFYVLGTLLLTGETRTTYSAPVVPLRNFDPRCWGCSGAWELVTRVSRLQLGDVVFAPGARRLADPTRFSSAATELTLGFNWYLNPWVRLQFNWEHDWFDDPVRLGIGPAGLLNHQDSLLTRFQVIF